MPPHIPSVTPTALLPVKLHLPLWRCIAVLHLFAAACMRPFVAGLSSVRAMIGHTWWIPGLCPLTVHFPGFARRAAAGLPERGWVSVVSVMCKRFGVSVGSDAMMPTVLVRGRRWRRRGWPQGIVALMWRGTAHPDWSGTSSYACATRQAWVTGKIAPYVSHYPNSHQSPLDDAIIPTHLHQVSSSLTTSGPRTTATIIPKTSHQ